MAVLRAAVFEQKQATLPKAGFLLLVYVDLLLTLFAVSHGFNEMNPMMVHYLSKPWELFFVKVVAPPFIAWAVPGKFLIPSIVLMLVVTAWNVAALLSLA